MRALTAALDNLCLSWRTITVGCVLAVGWISLGVFLLSCQGVSEAKPPPKPAPKVVVHCFQNAQNVYRGEGTKLDLSFDGFDFIDVEGNQIRITESMPCIITTVPVP